MRDTFVIRGKTYRVSGEHADEFNRMWEAMTNELCSYDPGVQPNHLHETNGLNKIRDRWFDKMEELFLEHGEPVA